MYTKQAAVAALKASDFMWSGLGWAAGLQELLYLLLLKLVNYLNAFESPLQFHCCPFRAPMPDIEYRCAPRHLLL